MELVGYFRHVHSKVYHIVYRLTCDVSLSTEARDIRVLSWTLCGLPPRNRKGEEDILEEAPISQTENVHLCLNCQSVQDSGMISIKEFEDSWKKKMEDSHE